MSCRLTVAMRARPVPPAMARAALGAVLAGEIILLTVRFDAAVVAGGTGGWADMLAFGPTVLRMGITAVAAALLFAGRGWAAELRRVGGMSPPLWWAWLPGHAAAFAVFERVTAVLLSPAGPPQAAGPWVLAWLGAGAATVGLLGLAALPARVWGRLLLGEWPSVLMALAVGAAAWGAGLATRQLWAAFGRPTLVAVAGLLHLCGQEVVCDPAHAVIGTPAFSVRVAPQCCGYEGVGLILAFAAGAGWLFRRDLRFPQALVLVPVGAALVWAANAARIAALILIGSAGARDVALGGFHSQAGWMGFNAVAVGLVLVSQRCRWFRAGEPATAPASPAAAYLLPLLTLVGVEMVTGAMTAGFDALYPVRGAAAGAVLWAFRRSYPRLGGSWAAVGIGLAVAVVWMALEPAAAGRPPPAELTGWAPAAAGAWVACRVAGGCLVVPLAEELAFRGYLARRLIGPRFEAVPPRAFTWSSLLVTAVLFGGLHDRWFAGTVAGLCYGLAVYRRGRLGDAVVAHATTNAALAAVALLTGDWGYWS